MRKLINLGSRLALMALTMALAAGFLASCGGTGEGDKAAGTPGSTSGARNAAAKGNQSNQEISFPVKVSPVQRRSISEYITTNTTVEAERMIDVLAKASGPVLELFIEEGQWVEAGAVLARLDQKELKLALQEAKLDLEKQTRGFEQTAELAKTNIVSQDEYENQKYQLEVSKIQVEKADLKLANTEIVSPINGIVTNRYISIGDTISVNEKVFSVGDFNPLIARIFIPEKEIGRVRIGLAVTITAESVPNQEFQARVRQVSPIVDAESGTVKITLEIGQSRNLLKPGMFITAYLAVATHTQALVVPKKAVVLEREQEVVYIVKDGRASRVPVGLGFTERDNVEVISGLNTGESVIVVGQESVQDGSNVRLISDGAQVAAPAGQAEDVGKAEDVGRAAESAKPSGAGQQGGSFDLSQIPAERRKNVENRLLSNPQVKAEYEKRLKVDPELKNNEEKRLAFFQEMIEKFPRSN